MKTFDVPLFYRSTVISKIKELRKLRDPRKKDFSPTILDFGPVRFHIARHFGFCYGVENAIEIAYRAVDENPNKRIFLLSQMIHNPDVNNDLLSKGIQFLMDTAGNQLIPWEELCAEDIVIIPAFGTTLKIEDQLSKIGIQPHLYDTTCPFVERVWKKSEKLGEEQFSVIIHGKYNHEETRATFSRSEANAPSIIVKNIEEARKLGDFILGKLSLAQFQNDFANRHSANFDPEKDLQRVGVINQTTMLATETKEIAEYFKQIMIGKYGETALGSHFSDTRDTLCYATNENQDATYGLLEIPADIAIVVGGYNSSNTSHLVELCEAQLPTYFISSANEIESPQKIHHFDFHNKKSLTTEQYLPSANPLRVVLTSGASCPDAVVEAVMLKIVSFFPNTHAPEEVLAALEA